MGDLGDAIGQRKQINRQNAIANQTARTNELLVAVLERLDYIAAALYRMELHQVNPGPPPITDR